LYRNRRFFLLGFCLLILFLEGSVRLAQPWLRRISPTYYYRQYMETLLRPSPVLVWEGIPGSEAQIANSAGRTLSYKRNSLGWREGEFAPFGAAVNGLVLGDSFSFGMGVAKEERFSEQLEQRLPGMNVWNQGEIGYAPDQYLLLAERWLPPFPWNFLVIQLSNNDLNDVAGHIWVAPHSTTGIPAELRAPPPYHWISGASELWNLFAYFALLEKEKRLSDEKLEDGLKRLLFSLRQTVVLAQARKVPVILLQASDWGEQAYGSRLAAAYREGVTALVKDLSIPLLEAKADAQGLLPFPDLHWTAHSHARAADLLLPELRRILSPKKK
jgi:hypothetical protein